MPTLSLQDLQRIVAQSWDEVLDWLVQKPRICRLARPEQQIVFELAQRLRASIRRDFAEPRWDRLFFDTSSYVVSESTLVDSAGRRPPILIDAHQLYGLGPTPRREPLAPDIAVAVHVLRAEHELLDIDEDGRPRHQAWSPRSMRVQGILLEERVREFEQLSELACAEGYLFVVYSNEARRKTAVDNRDVASWAAWKEASPTLWTASRRFRPRNALRHLSPTR